MNKPDCFGRMDCLRTGDCGACEKYQDCYVETFGELMKREDEEMEQRDKGEDDQE